MISIVVVRTYDIMLFFSRENLICCSLEPVKPVTDGGPLSTGYLDWQDLSFLSCLRVTRSTTGTYDPVLHNKRCITFVVRCLHSNEGYIIMVQSDSMCFS